LFSTLHFLFPTKVSTPLLFNLFSQSTHDYLSGLPIACCQRATALHIAAAAAAASPDTAAIIIKMLLCAGVALNPLRMSHFSIV
jgi:hypothetical protein